MFPDHCAIAAGPTALPASAFPRYDPGMSEQRKSVWPWIASLLIGVPILYVVSSGPMQTVAFRNRITKFQEDPDHVTMRSYVDIGAFWPKAFAPLIWASEQSWGEPLNWYWGVFPVRDVYERP
jgi:hypothetical protein